MCRPLHQDDEPSGRFCTPSERIPGTASATPGLGARPGNQVVWHDAAVSEGADAGAQIADERLGAGFQAMAAGDWTGARDAFSAVLAAAEVPEAFFGLANALFWLGD